MKELLIPNKEQELRYFAHNMPSDYSEVVIVPTGDVHLGNPYFSLKHFSRHIDYIRDTEGVYTVLMGDLCESTLKTSKGDIYRQIGTPQDQRDWMIEQLLPIREKILGAVTGNHEARINDSTGVDISADIAKALGIPYEPDGIYLKISFGSQRTGRYHRPYVFWVYATHGYGGARTNSAKAVKIERTSTFVHAHLYMMAHDHVVNVANAVYLIPDRRTFLDKDTGFTTGKAKAHVKKLLKTNSFLRWGGYAESGGFPPSVIETPYAKLIGLPGRRQSVRIES